MIHAYDKNYLAAAQKCLARMLDYMVNDLQYPLETVWNWFLMSEISHRFELGDSTILAGTSGVELARRVLEQAGEPEPVRKASYAYDRSPEYWTGWAIAYYQWDTGLRFSEIEQFADKMNELYRAAKPETNLKSLRTLAEMSQSELARQAEIPVRTIQQYEQRQKDINKAQGETLLRLARVLHCSIDDLMEKVPQQ